MRNFLDGKKVASDTKKKKYWKKRINKNEKNHTPKYKMKSKRESEGNKSLRLRLNKEKTPISKFHRKQRKIGKKNMQNPNPSSSKEKHWVANPSKCILFGGWTKLRILKTSI